MSRILTVSDAHLLSPDDPAWGDFLTFLGGPAADADLLVLNGDTFEFLVGRQKAALERYAPVIDRLVALTRTTTVVMLQGNHDFHLDGVLPAEIRVVDRWEVTTGAGRTIWLHGDMVAPTTGYRILRAVLRSSLVRTITEHFPARAAWHLATFWAHTSRDNQQDSTPEDMRVMAAAARKLLGPGDRMITGHYHLAWRESFADGAEWIGMPDWMNDRGYLVIDGDSAELRTFGPGAA